MRAATVLVGFMLLGSSVFAADVQVKQTAQKDSEKIVVARVEVKQMSAAPAQAAKPSVSRRARNVNQGDSGGYDYRLERESCCGPQ